MSYADDSRFVLTLDAGGTNFVFSALQGMRSIADTITLPSNGNNLEKCLQGIVDGFSELQAGLTCKPSAISFAFPGPADYPKGIIGDLGNLPGFRGGVALGPMLQEKFGIPVFINNDGDLFAYGEAIAGLLPWVNGMLKNAGSPKKYYNLFGITIGTGLGGGLVINNSLFTGDNSAGAEVWLLRDGVNPTCFAEEEISIRAVQRTYHSHTRKSESSLLSPKEIAEIADGKHEGDMVAARLAYQSLGASLGDALANIITITDSIVVVGGGLSNAYHLFAPAMLAQLNGSISTTSGEQVNRLESKVYDLEDEGQCSLFVKGENRKIKVPLSSREVDYDPLKRIGIGVSRLGTSHAVAIGAYVYALNMLDHGTFQDSPLLLNA
jgi:glucokinase